MSLTKWQPPTPRHDAVEDGRVTWLELFFDLVYVAALIQLGDALANDVSWSGVGSFAGTFVILWWTWTGTTAFMNRFAVDDVAHRVLTFVQMIAVGNLAIVAASKPDDWHVWFVVSYVAARLPLLIMYARAGAASEVARPLSRYVLRVFGASLVLWLVSIAVPDPARYGIWVFALLVEFAAPLRIGAAAGRVPAHDEHLQERYALFTIIVLGETFVKSLTAVVDSGISAETQLLGGVGFLVLVAIWWTYFDDVADAHIRSTSVFSKDRPRNRLIWIYTHLPLTAGITAFGVAAKKVLGTESLGDYLKVNYGWLLIGTLVVVLLAVAVLDLVTASPHYAVNAPERVGPRVFAAVALMLVGFALVQTKVAAIVTLSVVAAIVVAQIAVEVVIAQKSEYRLNAQVASDIEAISGRCEHLEGCDGMPVVAGHTCDACEAVGADPVQLRMCLICGHVGCCDDSAGQHARHHYDETGHALIATMHPGDDWAYCYLDDVSAPGMLAELRDD